MHNQNRMLSKYLGLLAKYLGVRQPFELEGEQNLKQMSMLAIVVTHVFQ